MKAGTGCLECTSERVMFWSAQRLPFEPKGEMRVLREELRSAVGGLTVGSGGVLTATLISQDPGFFDVENVLLYNVGTGSFGALATRGVRFVRIRSSVPAAPDGMQYAYHHIYSTVAEDLASPGDVWREWEFPLGNLNSTSKPHDVWWAATSTQGHVGAARVAPFGLHITLPGSVRGNLAALVKPLLDGVVSALHSDREPPAEAVARLARHTGWPTAEIESRLRAPPAPVLGPREGLLRPYRAFVKWNPADELCEVCSVMVNPAAHGSCRVVLFDPAHPAPSKAGSAKPRPPLS